MSAIANAGASAQCPGTTNINTNVTLKSSHQYTIINSGNTSLTVKIEVKLTDSRGHQQSETQNNITVPAQSTQSDSVSLFLTVAYSATGPINVRATTTITGGASASSEGNCSFQVINA